MEKLMLQALNSHQYSEINCFFHGAIFTLATYKMFELHFLYVAKTNDPESKGIALLGMDNSKCEQPRTA